MPDHVPDAFICHIAVEADWSAAQEAGAYRQSTRERSLDEEGFIHCSTVEQWPATLDRHYGDCDEPLVLLTIDTSQVPADIRIEGGFPHVYGPIPVDAVTRVEPLR